MNQKILAFEAKHRKKNPPTLSAGDTVRVHQLIKEGEKERVQIFEGLVIAQQHGGSMAGSYTVRKIGADNIAIERTFPIHLPTIIKVERIKTAGTRRSKLYFLRERASGGIKLKGEKRASDMWEEPMAEAELEKIKKEQEAQAAAKEEQRQKEEQELEKKFEQARHHGDAGQASPVPNGTEAKSTHDRSTQDAGGSSGDAGGEPPQK
ncbi:50S ribosomal protein L19 [Candidatus Berkelbacteria bacterium]|nr:50S ribosomal protein L19 [Candidatus Berkelbacteria bacterium]